MNFIKAITYFGLGAMSMLVSLTFWGVWGRIRHHSRGIGTHINSGSGDDENTINNININLANDENSKRKGK